jgi:dephospho-CoA kinase
MSHISSGAAKAIQLEQGFVFDYVPLNVKQKLEERLSGQYIVGVTGEIASGKSYLCARLAELGQSAGIPVHVMDIDQLGHELLESRSEPLYRELREGLIAEFGDGIKGANGFIDRKQLGRIIFNDREKLEQFNTIIYKPLLLRLRRELYGKKGLILLDSALIAESKMTYLCNNNVILVSTDKRTQLTRLQERSYSEEQIHQRINSQYSCLVKQKYIQHVIDRDNYGSMIIFENQKDSGKGRTEDLFHRLAIQLGLIVEKLAS